MFTILTKYDNYKVIFSKYLQSNDYKKAIFECNSKYPAYSLGKNDTSKSITEIYKSLEKWLFKLDLDIHEIEYIAFLDSYGSDLCDLIEDNLLSLNHEVLEVKALA